MPPPVANRDAIPAGAPGLSMKPAGKFGTCIERFGQFLALPWAFAICFCPAFPGREQVNERCEVLLAASTLR
jgi:hypothetical protein